MLNLLVTFNMRSGDREPFIDEVVKAGILEKVRAEKGCHIAGKCTDIRTFGTVNPYKGIGIPVKLTGGPIRQKFILIDKNLSGTQFHLPAFAGKVA